MPKKTQPNYKKVKKSAKKIYLLGILSIIFGIYLPPIGIVVGITGLNKAKSEGHSGGLSSIGIAIGCVMTVVLVVAFIWALFTFEF